MASRDATMSDGLRIMEKKMTEKKEKQSKKERQAAILNLIASETVRTQEELSRRLRENGFDATQATVSRDIAELNIIKTLTSDGQSKYISMTRSEDVENQRLLSVFSQAVTDLKQAENLLVLHTLPGMAQASAAVIDAMRLPEILGCIAGDDTIFVACGDRQKSRRLREQLLPLCHQCKESL